MDVGKKENVTLRSILEKTYVVDGKVDNNAIYVAEYFVSVYEDWRECCNAISKGSHDKKDEFIAKIDLGITGIFSGEALSNPAFINGFSDIVSEVGQYIEDEETKSKLIKLIISVLSGEVMANPFAKKNGEKIGSAVLIDCMNEVSRRYKGGILEPHCNVNKWSVISIIGFIVGGSTVAMMTNIALKESFMGE